MDFSWQSATQKDERTHHPRKSEDEIFFVNVT